VKIFTVGPKLDQFAEIKERSEIGNAAGLLHVVSDDHDCVLRLERLDQLLDFRRGNRVQRRAGLVHQYHLRFDGERACDAQTLLLATGQVRTRWFPAGL
jgi:hypothetical protein